MSKKEYFNAYYYRFESTGIDEIDNVLKEVARAGKMYHNTDMWNDEGDDGLSCFDRIQNIANESAKSIKSKQAECERLRECIREFHDADFSYENGDLPYDEWLQLLSTDFPSMYKLFEIGQALRSQGGDE